MYERFPKVKLGDRVRFFHAGKTHRGLVIDVDTVGRGVDKFEVLDDSGRIYRSHYHSLEGVEVLPQDIPFDRWNGVVRTLKAMLESANNAVASYKSRDELVPSPILGLQKELQELVSNIEPPLVEPRAPRKSKAVAAVIDDVCDSEDDNDMDAKSAVTGREESELGLFDYSPHKEKPAIKWTGDLLVRRHGSDDD